MRYESFRNLQPEFRNREDAGFQLARKIEQGNYPNPFILGLPCGGIPVAYEVAKALSAPLDIIVPLRLVVPEDNQFAFGAIAQSNIEILDADIIREENIDHERIAAIIAITREEMNRRVEKFRGSIDMPKLIGRTAIIVDDGIATGLTMYAAVKFAQLLNPLKVVVAAPVCSENALYRFSRMGVDVASKVVASGSMYVSQFYEDFDQTSEQEVIELLNRYKSPLRSLLRSLSIYWLASRLA